MAKQIRPQNPFAAPPATDPFASVPSVSPFGLASRAPSAVAPDAAEGSYEYRVVQAGPPVSDDECECAASAVDVRILWGRSVLEQVHLSPPRSFYVGEEQSKNISCDYLLPAEQIGTTRAPLVLARNASDVSVVLLAGAVGTIELQGQPKLTIHEAIEAGITQPCVELAGAHELPLRRGTSVSMRKGDLGFEISAGRAGRKAAAAFGLAALGTSGMLSTAASLLGHVGLLTAMAVFMPPMSATADDSISDEQRYLIQQYIDAAAELEPEQKPAEDLVLQEGPSQEGGTGTQAKGSEGSMGDPSSKQTGKHYAVEGSASNRDPHLARLAALRDAETFGMIGLINVGVGGDPNAPTAPWGRDESLGTDPLSARGNMWGDGPGDSFGAGGLGLSGIGEGGGGRGEGIGLGSVGTIGHGAGTGIGQGFGNSGGHLSRRHRASAPVVRVGHTEVSNGRLPPEVIQRIVRQNFGRFRLCYESGLRTSPTLQGRVVVRFVIGNDGRVSNVGGGGDLPDGTVVACVTRAFYGLSFPQPDGGIVTVSYPIVFTPGDAG